MKNLYEMILKMHKDANYSNLNLVEYNKNNSRDVIFMLKHLICDLKFINAKNEVIKKVRYILKLTLDN